MNFTILAQQNKNRPLKIFLRKFFFDSLPEPWHGLGRLECAPTIFCKSYFFVEKIIKKNEKLLFWTKLFGLTEIHLDENFEKNDV